MGFDMGFVGIYMNEIKTANWEYQISLVIQEIQSQKQMVPLGINSGFNVD